MMNLEQLTVFLGWCTAINVVMLFLASVALMLMRGFITRIHSTFFPLSEVELAKLYFQYLSQYKILILIFNLVPYVALKLI